MPDVKELGRRIKAKYPAYSDLSDEEVGRRAKAKYPGAYDDFTDTPAAPAPQPQGVFESFQTGVAGPLLRNVVETAVDVYNRPLETLERAGRAGLDFISAFDPAGNAYDPSIQAPRMAELRRRAEAERPENIRMIERGMQIEEGKPRTLAGRIAYGTGRVAGEVAFPTNPESAVQNIATIPFGGAALNTAGKVFKAGVNTVRRTLGKGVAQVIEAEAAPAAVTRAIPEAQPTGGPMRVTVRPPVGPDGVGDLPPSHGLPPESSIAGETIRSPVPAVDPLQSTFAKLGTDNVEQIGAMIANANRRLGKKRTPEQIQSSLDDYKALNQLTPDENRALAEVLPERGVSPVGEFPQGGYSREVRDIPASEPNPQLDANLRQLEAFFQGEGQSLQAAEDAAIMGDVGPGAISGQFGGQPARVGAADLTTTPPPTTPSTIGDRIRTMARTPTSPVLVGDLRRQFPSVGKKEFDDEMVRLVEEGEIALHRHDAPGQLTAAERDAMVKIGDNYYTAATLTEQPRIGAQTGPPAISADMSISGAAPSVRAASAGVTGPRVGADLELAAPGGGGQPPRPPFFSPDDPFDFGGPIGRQNPLFPQEPTTFTGVEPFQRAPQLQPLFDAAARSSWQDTALAYFRANLLTNPVGRAADLASTVVNQFADAAVRPIAAAVDVVVSKLTGSRSITGPSLRATGQAFGSIRQGLRDAREVLMTGQQAIESGAPGALYGNEVRTGLGKVADVPINGLFRLLGAMDAPFRRFSFVRNLSDRARVAAINEAKRGRIPQDQTIARARELMDRPDIIQAAVRDGEKAVLSESNAISSWATNLTRNSPNARLAFGLLQPFVRIPLNAVYKAVDFSGVGGIKALYKIARGGVRKAKGESFFRDLEEQRVFAQNVAAGSFAPAAFMLGMELEDRGKLEGYFYTGRRDFPGRRSPTSIDIGGTRYDIGRLGGFIFAPLFIGATYNRLRKEDVGKANALLRSFSGLIQQAPALGYHGFPAKAGRVLSADDMTGELAKEAGNVASGFLPASGALGATAQALDPLKKRQAEGFTGPIQAKIPILRQQLPATGNDAIDAAVDRNSPLLVELQRLGVRVTELQRGKDKQGKPEPEDKFNARVQQFGQNYTSYGLRLIQNPRFQIASDEVKAKALKRLNEKAKGLTRKQFAFPELELDPGLILDSVQSISPKRE